ncbi:hypothetical protein, partial [Thiolapillus sp.]|uniref:hypothetical protein n=1 Tax=Thiolapillus sp. TaxID=2017437 RepID=UPI003AF8FCFD
RVRRNKSIYEAYDAPFTHKVNIGPASPSVTPSIKKTGKRKKENPPQTPNNGTGLSEALPCFAARELRI